MPSVYARAVGDVLDVLDRALIPFVEATMKGAYGSGWVEALPWEVRRSGGRPHWDTQALLRTILARWPDFADRVSQPGRTYVHELKEWRNAVAHEAVEAPIQREDAWRAVDTACRLLKLLGAPQVRDAEALRTSLQSAPVPDAAGEARGHGVTRDEPHPTAGAGDMRRTPSTSTGRPLPEEPTVWVLRGGGPYFDAHRMFTIDCQVGLGWGDAGDLSDLPDEVGAFVARVEATHRKYAHMGPRDFTNGGRRLYEFVHGMHVGDVVVYPSSQDGLVWVGVVNGPYRYDPARHRQVPHVRAIRWAEPRPRASLSRAAQNQAGGRGTLWRVHTCPEEFIAIVREAGLTGRG